MSAVSRTTVESAVSALNAKCERLGWSRRYRLDAGSGPNGVQHCLEELVPELAHPVRRVQIGRTFREASTFLEAVDFGLEAALSERLARRTEVATSSVRMSFADPDARSVRRPADQL